MRIWFGFIALALVLSACNSEQPDYQGRMDRIFSTFEARITPEPTRTLVPDPPLASLVLEKSDMPGGFDVDVLREITNSASAEGYSDPKIALSSFGNQGRQTSWYVLFVSSSQVFAKASGVSYQVIRYSTDKGADAGLDYIVASETGQNPGYSPVSVSSPVKIDRIVAQMRYFDDKGKTREKYYFAIRKGHHVLITQVTSRAETLLEETEAEEYAYKAARRLP